MDTLGNAIQKRRKKLKIKGYELAAIAGVRPPYITAIEKGREYPSEKTFLKITKALGNSPEINYLYEFYREGKPNSAQLRTMKSYTTEKKLALLIFWYFSGGFPKDRYKDDDEFIKGLINDFYTNSDPDPMIYIAIQKEMEKLRKKLEQINVSYTTTAGTLSILLARPAV